ncbi:HlyD family efflux transporter periplasmic adaptor subunit [Ramlibacter sp. USB13]|uniref:HlyD family efflux transporter periplasmic adaptor subunit n=1 Tax=Ramlibacter cellulosilyticus TaxID=2764187 RepID=A0A923MYC7_9BURK|nr:HlyD family efflux transporter periplasmic adaptor subunit [Ramlibacter cellulosilyticus]MBC5785962.1 HlyD family efflux transporter periplasmic adaptor subunit [Ramlibacter cellulosilyticus]
MRIDEAPASPATTAPRPWAGLPAGSAPAEACTQWLAEFAGGLPEPTRSLVLLRADRQELRLAAVHPAGSVAQDLAPLLSQAAATLKPERFRSAGGWLVTQPLAWGEDLRGLVAAEFAQEEDAVRGAARLAWGAGWLLALLAGQGGNPQALAEARNLLQFMAAMLGEQSFDAACLSLANRLAARWRADAVLVGWVDRLQARIVARSNASRTDERANVTQLATAAMEEALDLRQTVQGHGGNGFRSDAGNLPAHAALAKALPCEAVITAVLFHEAAPVGAVLLQRGSAFSAEELETLDTQCMMLAPVLAQRRAAERSLWQHAGASVRHALHRAGDDSLLGWKLGSLTLVVALAVAAVTPVPFRITAPALVEGEVQRSIVAPFQGFVQQAYLRAGDTVRAGDVIASLDDADLKLDAEKARAELDVAERKEREAVAAGKRVDMRLAAAQAAQARATLDLAEQKLQRVQLVAPFDGVIVRGDLSQQRGSPVEQGKVLFELAPLTAWRLILKVDERDIAYVQSQRQGELALTGLAGVTHPFEVKRITSIASAEGGVNHFRAEADLGDAKVSLRPGMEGVAKIDCGSASALWVATRRLLAWTRLAVWEWTP